jgi:hypothetical protein
MTEYGDAKQRNLVCDSFAVGSSFGVRKRFHDEAPESLLKRRDITRHFAFEVPEGNWTILPWARSMGLLARTRFQQHSAAFRPRSSMPTSHPCAAARFEGALGGCRG